MYATRRVIRSYVAAQAFVPLAIALAITPATPALGKEIMRETIDLSGAGWRLWLDKDAPWKEDRLHLPPVKVSELPVRPPTGGWKSLPKSGIEVSVPGTVEEHYWDEIGDYTGVSWWYRNLPASKSTDRRRVLLRFEAVRQRAEVFLDETLVGYDCIGNTPFEVDLTPHVKPGATHRLAVRITDHGGNFTWIDTHVDKWGEQCIPAGHGFGGVTGPVRLEVVDEVYIDNVFIKNKPAITEIDVDVTVRNTTGKPSERDLRIRVSPAGQTSPGVFEQTWKAVKLPAGDSVITRTVSVPDAKPWSVESPNMYACDVALGDHDRLAAPFGFRWFAPEGVGENARFMLNGKRIFVCSAISWGFWPINGIYPTEALARRNIEAAKNFGMNMLNFHRCIGQPLVLDLADRMGLLYFQEPGGYICLDGDAFSHKLAREKWLRMVRRDRNHPSLVIYNEINECIPDPEERHKRDMADAHVIDPTRTIVYTSGWAKEGDDPIKLHMRPYDDRQYIRGWFDHHHACGPGVYRDEFYKGPKEYMLRTENRGEIVFWGEEGAIATPPRLELIRKALKEEGRNGWDGKHYVEWYDAYAKYLDDKKLRGYFPTVDSLTTAMGDIALYYQGRIIENTRIGDATDGYVINGWEAEKIENHSGVVDCFRNPKGRVELIADYNKPTYVAVKVRNKVGAWPMTSVIDFWLVSPGNLPREELELLVMVRGPNGSRDHWTNKFRVTAQPGQYGQLLLSDVAVKMDGPPGKYTVEAVLRQRGPVERPPGHILGNTQVNYANGRDEILTVDWATQPVSEKGAVIENDNRLQTFFRESRRATTPAFQNSQDRLDWIAVGEYEPIPRVIVPVAVMETIDGNVGGLTGTYFKGARFEERVFDRVDGPIDFNFGPAGPDERVGPKRYSIRWEGVIRPTESGPHRFFTRSDDGVRLWIDDKLLIDRWDIHAPTFDSGEPMDLEEGKTYAIKLEHFQWEGSVTIQLYWSTPSSLTEADRLLDDLLRRTERDGTTVAFLSHTDDWAVLLDKRGLLKYRGRLDHGLYWLGGNFFVREHPLFAGLPVNCGMNWEYQEIVHYGRKRFGLLLEGEEAVAGCVTGHERAVATAVGVVSHGKGRIILSTLDLLPVLNGPPGPADVARKIVCNYLSYSSPGTER